MQDKKDEEATVNGEGQDDQPKKRERARISRKVAEKVVPQKKEKENPFSDRNAKNAEFAREEMVLKPSEEVYQPKGKELEVEEEDVPEINNQAEDGPEEEGREEREE